MLQTPLGYRRNMALLAGNYVFFGLGLALFSSNTVMPVFMRHLTDSAPLIGFVSALFPLGWMLPQLVAARWVSGIKHRKPLLVYLSISAPLIYAALAGFMFTTDPARSQALLGIFIGGIVLVGLTDGVIGVPWLDFVGRAIPAHVRGRMMGAQEVLYAAVSVGAGALIAYLLSDAAPAFPVNFAWLAVAAAGAFLIALIFFLPLVEPEAGVTAPRQPSWSEYLLLLRQILRTDRAFVTMTAVRVLGAFAGLSLPFYILYGTSELGLPARATGFYLSTQMIGSALGSMALGYLYDRRGSRLVIRIVMGMGLLAPLSALLLPLSGLRGNALLWPFAIVFFTAALGGSSAAAMFIGFTNFIIDHCPPAQRPIYLGLSNTLTGPTALAATLGGWLLQRTDYPVLFLTTLAVLSLAFLLSFRLPEPRSKAG